MTDYHYKACGLDNVLVRGFEPVTDDEGHSVYRIPNVNLLHKAIAAAIVKKPVAISGKELRYLRTELGFTQSELAKFVHREALSVSRWERGETEIESNAEVVIRILATEVLDLKVRDEVRLVTERVVPSAQNSPILIDGSDPDDYQPLAA